MKVSDVLKKLRDAAAAYGDQEIQFRDVRGDKWFDSCEVRPFVSEEGGEDGFPVFDVTLDLRLAC